VSSLQIAFVTVLSLLLVTVLAFAAFVVRTAHGRRHSAAGAGWLARLGRSASRDAQRWAFVSHRISGVAVFAFLALHVLDVSLLAISPARFNNVHRLYGSAPMRVFECLLLFAILFHTFNGLRLIVLDLAELSARTARQLLQMTVALVLVIGVTASIAILGPTVA
jgi:succinate dehydrogenase / fumarate reductase cytochrome b subunit